MNWAHTHHSDSDMCWRWTHTDQSFPNLSAYVLNVTWKRSTDLLWDSDGELLGEAAGLPESKPFLISDGFSEWEGPESVWESQSVNQGMCCTN